MRNILIWNLLQLKSRVFPMIDSKYKKKKRS